jgi:hypothetical protein
VTGLKTHPVPRSYEFLFILLINTKHELCVVVGTQAALALLRWEQNPLYGSHFGMASSISIMPRLETHRDIQRGAWIQALACCEHWT